VDARPDRAVDGSPSSAANRADTLSSAPWSRCCIDRYPEAQAGNGGYNMIRRISPTNPNRPLIK
jgi:hypothetical protein